jgi:hypothetical protein
MNSNVLKITRKENSFEIYLFLSFDQTRLTPLMATVHFHPSARRDGSDAPSSVVATLLGAIQIIRDTILYPPSPVRRDILIFQKN